MAARTGQDAAQMPFIKNLASSDRKLRTSSLDALAAFLSSRRTLPEADARKLWTGLYYALWMTDRPRPQQALAASLADLVFSLRSAAGRAAWLRAFWHVLGARWTGIEALRLNKFLLLARRVWAAMVRLALRDGGGGAERAAVAAVCRECVLDGQGGRDGQGALPLGLRLHVLDVWVDELEREGALAGRAEGLVAEIGEMVLALTRNGSKAVRERARESYEDERLPWASKEDEDEDEDDGEDSDDGWGGIED